MAVLLTGHVTKDGEVAGPRALEHAVDVVLTFDGDARSGMRVLTAGKNRFGAEGESAWFEMNPDGLREVDPTTLNGLAKHMGVTAATMSLTIDRLERKGYVVRLRDTTDRRRVHVRLTSAGVRVRNASSVLDPPRVEQMLARLSDGDREAAIRGLRLLADAAQEQMSKPSPSRPAESEQAG